MSLLDSLRLGINRADKTLKSLQSVVRYQRYVSANGQGDVTYASSVDIRAHVDWTRKQVRTKTGELSLSRAVITILDIASVVAATSGRGFDDKDKFTLPDGTTGPILALQGYIDAGTTHPISTEVMLG